MIYAIVMNLVGTILGLVAPELAIITLLINLAALIVSVMGMVKLFQGFNTAIWARVLMFISMLIPLINLIVLLRLNSRATRELRAAGYQVGLMGASK